MPLIFALVVAILLGVAIGWLTPKVRSSKRHDDV
jgi:F0F1-type ATP synthase assembly protein I